MNHPKAALPLLLLTAALAPAVPVRAADRVAPAVPASAALFPLEDVRLLPGPFKDAQETDHAYLLRLDPDRLLSWMRKNAGLTPKASPYAGWDRDGSGIVGHYLSACALMAEATGDPALHKRVDYIVSEMAACQAAGGDGGLYAFAWDKTNYFPLMAAGHPVHTDVTAWYAEHKILAGLWDAYALCGSVQARDVLVRMADWCVSVTAKLTDDQWQMMLSG